MKKALCTIGLAVAVGYGARGVQKASGEKDVGVAAESAEKARSGALTDLPARGTSDRSPEVRAAPGFARLFPPGHARDWLAGLDHANWDDDFTAIQLAQECGRMDANSAEELAMECLKISDGYRHADAAVEEVFPSQGLQGHLAMQAFARLGQLDPARAFAILNQREGAGLGFDGEVVSMVFETVARQNPKLAISALDDVKEGDRASAYQAVIRQLTKTDPETALALLEEAPDGETSHYERLSDLAVEVPDLVLQSAAAKARSGDSAAIEILIAQADELRPQIAAWAASYDGANAAEIRGRVVTEMADADVKTAAGLFDRVKDSLPQQQQVTLAGEIARNYALDNRAAAKAWLGTLDNGPLREEALASMAEGVLEGGKMITRNNIDAVLNSQDSRTNMDSLGNIDELFPAADTVAGRTDNLSPNLVAGALRSDNTSDPEKWLEEMAPSPRKEEVTVRLIQELQDENGTRAMEWVETLADGPQKEKLRMQTTFKTWLYNLEHQPLDPAAAGAVIGR